MHKEQSNKKQCHKEQTKNNKHYSKIKVIYKIYKIRMDGMHSKIWELLTNHSALQCWKKKLYFHNKIIFNIWTTG